MNTKIRQAVLLAAGKGTRLGALTGEMPKCMVKVGKRRLIDRILKNLEQVGVTSLIVVTGYCRDLLESHLETVETAIKITTVFCPDYETTNNIVSLWRAQSQIDSDFILLESDLILNVPTLRGVMPANCAAVSPLQSWMNGTVTTLRDNGDVGEFYLKGDTRPDQPLFKTVNVYGIGIKDWDTILWPALDEKVRAGHTGVYYEEVFAEQIAGGSIMMRASVVDPREWFEVDTQGDLQRALEFGCD